MAALEEVQAEVDAGDDLLRVPLGPDAVEIEVLPVNQWRSRGNSASARGDFETWAELCCTEAGYESWQTVDPTLEDVNEFFVELKRTTGQDPGKSGSSRHASKTRRSARR